MWIMGGSPTWKRTRLIVLILAIVTAAALIVLTPTSLYTTFALMVRKSVGYLTPVLLAHFLRIGLFPYLDLSELIKNDKIAGTSFAAVWYGVSIWAFSLGG
jgi:hypothetical protein